MKKRNKLIILLGIIAVVIIAFGIFKSFEKNYIKQENINIELPSNYTIKEYKKCDNKYTLYYDDNNNRREKPKQVCIEKIVLTSLEDKLELNKTIVSIIDKYDSKICSNKDIYYDKDKNVTIFKYELSEKNEVIIEYIEGNINDDDCKLINNINNIEYKYDRSYYYPLNSDIRKSFSYIGIDNIAHDVYSDCGDCLTIKNGKGTYETFKSMIRYSYIDMETLILLLEKQSDQGIAIKKNNEIGTLYTNDEFQLFVCGPELKNNIYISDKINLSDVNC